MFRNVQEAQTMPFLLVLLDQNQTQYTSSDRVFHLKFLLGGPKFWKKNSNKNNSIFIEKGHMLYWIKKYC